MSSGSPRAYTYNIINDFDLPDDADYSSFSPYWIIAVIRLGAALSFDRSKMASYTTNVASGALLRNEKPLIITDDCLFINRSTNKANHVQTLSAQLKMTDINYLVELLPGDWVMAWMFNNEEDYLRIQRQLEAGEPCNKFKDGFKFLGRLHDVRKSLSIGTNGMKTSNFSIQAIGFEELDTQFFYDNSLASHDTIAQDLGQWLARLGVKYQKLFANVTGLSDTAVDAISSDQDFKQNNINSIVPTLIDLIIGEGPASSANIDIAARRSNVSATPSLAALNSSEGPKYAYMIPKMVGKLLGKEGSKGGDVIGYSDILELLQGIQKYSSKSNNIASFVPELRASEYENRRVCTADMLGTFIPYMPDFCNKPLWSILQQYLNPTINEMYTTLRVNPKGDVVPTVVMRQIPFTTDAFVPNGQEVTRFLDVPRWQIPVSMVEGIDIGRSNATRVNFVHIYGSSSYLAQNVPVQLQIVNNPPVRDDLDIMRSGLKSYMATVECFTGGQVGLTPKKWINLVSDWAIGHHLTFNGTIRTRGIQAPIAHGDNLVFDGIVYHIESINDNCGIDPNGNKFWSTTIQLSNGMRDTQGVAITDNENGLSDGNVSPIYPGFFGDDNTDNDPGITLDGNRTKGGRSERTPADTGDFERLDREGGSVVDTGSYRSSSSDNRSR